MTPMERFLNLIVTGPNRIPFSWRSRNASRQAVAYSQREEGMGATVQSNDPGLDVIHPQAAGIDIGNAAHYVAARPDRDPEPVRRFDCFTADLHRLADWLNSCGVIAALAPA